MRRLRTFGAVLAVIGVALALSGCLAAKTVTAPVKLAAVTVVTVGETTGSAVVNAGKVARAAFSTSGSLSAATIESLGKLSTAGMVTFVDVAADVIVRVPWREGLTIASSGELAQLDYAAKALALVRGGKLVLQAGKAAQAVGRLPLEAGDVIRLAGRR